SILVIAGLRLVGLIGTFRIYLAKNNEKARLWGHRFLKLSFVVQACAIAMFVGQVKTATNVVQRIDTGQYVTFGKWLAEQEGLKPEQIAQIGSIQLSQAAADFVAQRGST